MGVAARQSRPFSGFEPKIDEPRKPFITTLFCYGCNLGATQTARSVKNLNRKQVAWLNLRHVSHAHDRRPNLRTLRDRLPPPSQPGAP
jgi:hypothetical protein